MCGVLQMQLGLLGPLSLDQIFIQIHKTDSNTTSYTPVQLTENISLLLSKIIEHQTLQTISRTHDQIW